MLIGSVVQLDRMSDSGSDGWGFESLRSHKNISLFLINSKVALGVLTIPTTVGMLNTTYIL